MTWIKDLQEGASIKESFLVNNVTKGVTGNNMPYLTITLQDKTGTIDGKKWDVKSEDADIFTPGNIVQVSADVIYYKNSYQLKVLSGEKVKDEKIDYARYTMSAPVPQDELEAQLKTILASIKDEDISLLVNALIEKYYDKFVTYPAAVRNHHEFTNGLLYHTISMVGLADKIASFYPSIDRDLLVGGVLLHDLGKTIELSGPIIPKYTTEGKLLGHISIMAGEIRKIAEALKIESEVPTLLAHMVLSHHGKMEFGSPVTPLLREALVLSMIDDLDAKMIILDKAYAETAEGEFTSRIYPIDDSYFYKQKTRK